MASSRKRSRDKGGGEAGGLVSRVAGQLASLVKPGDRLVAGLSGGVDSVVLLDILHRLSARLGFRFSALHVNHQLSPNAARWSAFCRRICRARGIPFASAKVRVRRGDSVEAAARAARYEVFARQACEFVVLAHHQDDQVETLLLQLLRGAGVKGLAAMPPVRKGIFRPLLDVTRAEILAYARRRGLEWIEDESNADIHFQRNFLRHEVLPLLARRFPAYRGTVARVARHLAEADDLLAVLAAADGAGYLEDGTLEVAALARLSPPRARNLLRHFLAVRGEAMPGAARLDEALRQALHARRDAQVLVELDGSELRRFEGRLHVVPKLALPRAGHARRWRGERTLPLPELGGVLVFTPCRGKGVSLARLRGRPVTIRRRRGGERLQPDGRRPRRTLKNLLQEARLPPWERERLPLIYCGRDLVWAPVAGVDCAYQAAPRERALNPEWRPAGAP